MPRTINHALSVLNEFYRHAIDADLGPVRSPVPLRRSVTQFPGQSCARAVAGGPAFRQREPVAQPRALSEPLLQQLFAALRNDRDRALVAVALSSGARASELLSMVRNGIDVGLGVVSVVPKGRPGRVWIPLAPEALVLIGRYLAAQPPGLPDDPVWMTIRRPASTLTYFAMRQVLERVNHQLGANITWHDFRHTFAHRLLADDQLSLTDVQTLMRHRSMTTLADYSASRLDELVTRLHEHLARPAPPPTPAVGYDQSDMQVLFPRFDAVTGTQDAGRVQTWRPGRPVPAVQAALSAGGIDHLDREHLELLMRALITETLPPSQVSVGRGLRARGSRRVLDWLEERTARPGGSGGTRGGGPDGSGWNGWLQSLSTARGVCRMGIDALIVLQAIRPPPGGCFR